MALELTALCLALEVLCVHIERWINLEAQMYLVTSPVDVPASVAFPIFTGHNMQCEWQRYTPIAMTSHLGQDGAGHYVAALKLM